MPINPHTDDVAATAWADQFGAELHERAQKLLEASLRNVKLCSRDFDITLVQMLDAALQLGAIAMGELLEEKGRLKEVEG